MNSRLLFVFILSAFSLSIHSQELQEAVFLAQEGVQAAVRAGIVGGGNCPPQESGSTDSIQLSVRSGENFSTIESTQEFLATDANLLQVLRDSGLITNQGTTHETAKTPFVLHYGGANNLSSSSRNTFRYLTMDIRYQHMKIMSSVYNWDVDAYENYNSTPEFHAIMNPETNEPIGILAHSYVCLQTNYSGTSVDSLDARFTSDTSECVGGKAVRISQVFSYSYNPRRRSLSIEPLSAGVSVLDLDNGTTQSYNGANLENVISQMNIQLDPYMETALTLNEYVCDENVRSNMSFSRSAHPRCSETNLELRRRYFTRKSLQAARDFVDSAVDSASNAIEE